MLHLLVRRLHKAGFKKIAHKVFVAFILCTISALAWSEYLNRREIAFTAWEKSRPVDDWISVISVYVRDLKPNPLESGHLPDGVEFERVVKRDMQGDWEADVINKESGKVVCTGSGSNKYYISEPRLQRFSFYDFVGNTCPRLSAGTYQLSIRWDFRDLSTNMFKTLLENSNEFVVEG